MTARLLPWVLPLPPVAATVSAAEARDRILRGAAGPNLTVRGHLDLSKQRHLTALPPGLSVTSLDLSNCSSLRALPPGLQVTRLNVSGCDALQELPPDLRCYELAARETPLKALPPDLRVAFSLDLSGCWALERLPDGLSVGSLVLRGCPALAALPEGLDVCFLDVSGCTRLRRWPAHGSLRIGRLVARGCTALDALPAWMARLAQLDVGGCIRLGALPETLQVTSWIDLADSGIAALPAGRRGAQLRWRGVAVDERIAFHPETITADEVLAAPNVERRRVLLECMGYERFLHETRAEVLDRDRDAGGERQLLRVPLERDEPLVCVAVRCPSTGRQYVLRVPPHMRTCRQAVAWTAGFADPDDYRPVAET